MGSDDDVWLVRDGGEKIRYLDLKNEQLFLKKIIIITFSTLFTKYLY